MNLFQLGDFTLSSGKQSQIKIECDVLSDEDWKTLAYMASRFLPPFSCVVGIPTGGLPLAAAMEQYLSWVSSATLICDDVLTTGGSMEFYRKKYPDSIGLVAFSRAKLPPDWWIKPIWTLG